MAGTAEALDPQVAALLERLARATGLSEACSVVLDRALSDGRPRRALVTVRGAAGLRTVGYGVSEPELEVLRAGATDSDSPLRWALERSAPALAGSDTPPLLDFPAFAALPFPGLDRRTFGVVMVEAGSLDGVIRHVHEVFRRCGPGIARCAQVEELEDRSVQLRAQLDLLNGVVNALPDPVLLTDSENNIILANSRAEQLLAVGPEDSEGRRRAIQINNLLFSSFLTQVLIGPTGGGRELNLVDPSEGSDLLFEALSAPLLAVRGGAGAVISILRDITDLKRAVAELEVQFNRFRAAEHRARRERDRLNVILENVGDPILVTDANSNIMLMNREAERLFEVPGGAVDEARRRRMVWTNDTKFSSLISDFLLQPAQRRVEKLELTDPESGEELPLEVVSSKILDARGEPTAIVAVLHDLTQVVENQRLAGELQQLNLDLENRIRRATAELEERNRQLEWQSQQLEEASRLKSEFLASMSHELRTPINVLLGYTSLMRERIYGELSEQQETALDKVYSSSQHLLELINDILDLSKIEAGKMPVHIEEVDLAVLIQELSGAAEPLLNEKDLAYQTHVEPDLPLLRTDRTKLKQILLNLLSNAIKFTPSGFVRVEVTRDSQREVAIRVSDSGIGIKSEDIESIFEDFRQADQSPTREYPGTGLGLSITRKLLVILGGGISVESTYGEGSAFTVTVPVSLEPGAGSAALRAEDEIVLEPAARLREASSSRLAASRTLDRLALEARAAGERLSQVLAGPDPAD